MSAHLLDAARSGDQHAFSELTEPHRRELLVHCYRILGTLHDAEDVVQTTLLRAWRRLDTYEGRASLRAWLYKIATNACLDTLDKRPRRTLPPLALSPADPNAPLSPPISEPLWLEPFPDELLPAEASAEARYSQRESITLAFLTALQLLPPRQRAVLILRDVLDWSAAESAALLDITVSAVNSALHRARVTLSRHYRAEQLVPADDALTRDLLKRYLWAWENADVNALVLLLKEDAAAAMPPLPSWYHGRANIALFLKNHVLTEKLLLAPTRANGQAAFVVSRRMGTTYTPFAVQVMPLRGGLFGSLTLFLNVADFGVFGLPPAVRGSKPKMD